MTVGWFWFVVCSLLRKIRPTQYTTCVELGWVWQLMTFPNLRTKVQATFLYPTVNQFTNPDSLTVKQFLLSVTVTTRKQMICIHSSKLSHTQFGSILFDPHVNDMWSLNLFHPPTHHHHQLLLLLRLHVDCCKSQP